MLITFYTYKKPQYYMGKNITVDFNYVHGVNLHGD